ncbi:MAG: adenylosuccinate synthase [Chloroflexi bacterium]|nr:adenylosuccinate synthase [Chloroflexota bacterium]
MPAIVVTGAQWGDEGKGKVTDLLAGRVQVVARYGGGDNAGHSVQLAGERFALHQIPSGILCPGVVCVMGNGMVVNPKTLNGELEMLAGRGVDISPERLKLSDRAHLNLPQHQALDGAAEAALGGGAIGTTRRGIGPCYSDKAARTGMRAAEMRDPSQFAKKLAAALQEKNLWLQGLYGLKPLPVDALVQEYAAYARRLAPHLADTSLLVNQTLQRGQMVLCEGAQGTLLDLDHGTYPFVTSSYPTSGGATVGLGIAPRWIERVIGVAKAYSSRVGAGPFPTELFDAVGDRIVEVGHEYGTTTGRRRRVGWLDLVALRYSARINGLDSWGVTLLDVLTGIHPLRLAVAYRYKGLELTELPSDPAVLAACEPVFVELPGWDSDITTCSLFEELPAAAQRYIRLIEDETGVAVDLVSVGPDRQQTILRRDLV